MKRAAMIFLTVLLAGVLLIGCGKDEKKGTDNKTTSTDEVKKNDTDKTDTKDDAQGASDEDLLSGKHHAEIVIKDHGTIKVELDADVAPITVTNFIDLAKDGFYDGLTFHRIIEGFMMQGGDPNGNGSGGSDKTIKGEFMLNGVENTISHLRGTISMARATNPDSASSQFFIMHKDNVGLDGQYAGFGFVTEGMEIVDEICESAQPIDNNGTIPAEQQPVIETVKVID